MPIKTVIGNLLDATEDWICHQCNCITKQGKGLSEVIFAKWPEADIYKERKDKGKDYVGQIIVRGKVINMLAQVCPGKPKYKNDTKEKREEWFQKCLDYMDELEGSFAFPYQIGCGLAQGDWSVYYGMLEKFAEKHDVTIYQLQ